ncbi:ribonucleoside-diphosphate reductase subunit alpha [Chitinibacter tainanensis]|uniref:ribonucleoside-diphosphate reductase subunit alpha n=1 Tax=Chitinibacter tainanensis TaxID=230667 RepID=UPI00042832D5|nr:ribonucleoside-diphosphate reductase subunit alpha [Chitinibacter tainanensis]
MLKNVQKRSGSQVQFNSDKLLNALVIAGKGLDVDAKLVLDAVIPQLYEGISTHEIQEAAIRTAAGFIALDKQDYRFFAARLMYQRIIKEVTGGDVEYPSLESYIAKGVKIGRLNPVLDSGLFNFKQLNDAIDPSRDLLFDYQGISAVADRYLIRLDPVGKERKGKIIEMPQHFFMRVAMGLAINEPHPTLRAIEFYNVLSTFDFMSSTPTLFNAGTPRSQLSSCYLNTVADTLTSDDPINARHASIYGTIEECAMLSKWAGGIGTDWTRVRGEGALIKGTQGKSAGTIPYLKVFNDTAVAVNQGGKRNGAFAAYMEPWHPDFPAFCELKKNTGDERRRAHDIFPASWIPDEFMKRVKAKAEWFFIDPSVAPELHDLYGEAFSKRYNEIVENEPEKIHSQMPARKLWRKMLTMLFETGHPWVNFKDACNLRSPQDHVGVVHNSNLCTEITLNTSDDETAVCNLGSVNLSRHLIEVEENGEKYITLDSAKLKRTVSTAMRMLDNVIDINFYPSERARASNLRHRPVGLGIMGYTEWLAAAGYEWDSREHLEAADRMMEWVSYCAIIASCELAQERGAYPSFAGSKWSKGILPIDTVINKDAVAALHDGEWSTCDWEGVRELVMTFGMRNSNCMAIAPTATISNIVGTTPCIEPVYQREYTASNLGGDYRVIDPTLRYGRKIIKTAFEIAQTWLIKAAAVRGKWIDQSQSLNIFVDKDGGIDGPTLSGWYELAWELGCKTTYYLRTPSSEVKAKAESPAPELGKMCAVDNPDCESCQ